MSNTNNSFPAKLDLSIFVRGFVRDVNPKQSSILHPPFEPLGAQAGKLQWHALPGTRSVYGRYFSSNHLTWMWEGQPHMTGGLLIKRPSWLSCMKNCLSVQAFQPILQEPAETPGKCKPKPNQFHQTQKQRKKLTHDGSSCSMVCVSLLTYQNYGARSVYS